MANNETMELNEMNNVELNEENIVSEETGNSSVKDGLILGAAGLALVGLGFGIKAGIDKIKAKRAEKKAGKAEEESVKKEKKVLFWKKKQKASTEEAHVEEVKTEATVPEEEKAETGEEES